MQDLLNPEFFVSRFLNPGADWVSTNYSDTLPVPMDANAERVFAERRVAYCTLPPGTAPWASSVGRAAGGERMATDHDSARQEGATKRGREDVADDAVEHEKRHAAADEDSYAAPAPSNVPMMTGDATNNASMNVSTATPPAGDCMLFVRVVVHHIYQHVPSLQMYGDDAGDSEVKLTEVVEVIAVLSFLPELATLHLHTDDMLLDDGPTAAEALAAHPPTSRVPRLHVLLLRTPRTADVPPLLPPVPTPVDLGAPGAVAAAREATLALLTGVMGGDALAAEYLLLTLLSKCVDFTCDIQ